MPSTSKQQCSQASRPLKSSRDIILVLPKAPLSCQTCPHKHSIQSSLLEVGFGGSCCHPNADSICHVLCLRLRGICNVCIVAVLMTCINVVTGGGKGFAPLAGLLRGARPPLSAPPVVSAAHQFDRLSVALAQRPAVRAALALYLLLLHLYTIV